MPEQEAGTAEAYCRNCYYLLWGIGEKGKCPECGGEFDLEDLKTFSRHPRVRAWWRRLRWPLALLLLLVLAAAGGVGWLYWEWRQEQPAIAWVSERGSVDTTRLIGPRWLQERAGRWSWLLERVDSIDVKTDALSPSGFPLGRFRRLRRALVWGQGVTDAQVQAVVASRDLEELLLEGTLVGDAGLMRVGRLPQLRLLSIDDSPVSDDALAVLAGFPELRELHLTWTRIQGPGLVHLHDVSKLERLYLMNTAVGDEAMAAVGQCAELKVLNVANTKVTAAGMRHLAGLGKLERLELAGTTVDDTAVDALAQLTGLKELCLRDTKVTWSGVSRLKKALPAAKIDSDVRPPPSWW